MAENILEIPAIRRRGFNLKREFPKEFNSWRAMIARCTDPKYVRFDLYGGRGIKVYEPWRSFKNFLRDMGSMPSPTHSLDRFPNKDGDYEPGNCRWATQTEQMRNMGRNHMLTLDGETRCISEWSEITGIPEAAIHHRLDRGWTTDRVLRTPARAVRSPFIEWNGMRLRLSEWAKQLGIGHSTLWARLYKQNLPPSIAFTMVDGRTS